MNLYRGVSKLNKYQICVKIFAILALFLMPNLTYAITQGEVDAKNQELQEAKEALNGITAQRRTLQGEVANIDSQVKSIQGQVYNTQAEINRITGEINTTNVRIAEAEAELVKARTQLSEIVRIMYEEGQVSNIELIAKSNNFSEFVNRSEYFEAIQLKIKESSDKVIALKNELDTKKKQLEESKKKTEELKAQQLAQQSQVSAQLSAKDLLLQRTKGDEAAYQALVKKTQKDFANLQSALWNQNNPGGSYVSLGHVNAGDIIGYIGNSGYSTGCHLHFEMRNAYQTAVNPAAFIGDGFFIHPTPGVWMSAPFGYSSSYFPGVYHTGIDYADGCKGTPIRATGEGEIIKRVTGRPNTYDWSVEYGNYVMIKHTNGMYSLYGHMR